MIYRLCQLFLSNQEQKQAARKLLSYALNREYGIAYNENSTEKNEWGKPYLSAFPQVFYSISHSEESVAVILGSCRVGVDTEKVRSFTPAVVERVCSDAEKTYILREEDKNKAFFRLWTLKESYIKALGVGMSYPLREAQFLLHEDLNIIKMPSGASFRLFENESGIVTAACIMDYDADDTAFVLHDVQYDQI